MSGHPSEDDLVLHHYGESDHASVAKQLAACAYCRASYQALQRVLAAVSASEVPERDAGYGAAVWRRLRPRLQQPPARAKLLPFVRRFVPVGAIAASLVLAFVLGRTAGRNEVRVAQPIPAPARERILLVAVGEHLERSQMVLIELQNATGNGSVDIQSERDWAEQLVPANRLYRQAALRAGEPGVASVLDDLERVLVEIATSPDQLAPAALEELRQRIEAQGILFKVRVLGSQVRERETGSEARRNWSKS